MKPVKTMIPKFVAVQPAPYPENDEISLSVNGDVKARFLGEDLARLMMNDIAVMLIENYYPEHHFVIALSRGDDVIETTVL